MSMRKLCGFRDASWVRLQSLTSSRPTCNSMWWKYRLMRYKVRTLPFDSVGVWFEFGIERYHKSLEDDLGECGQIGASD